MVNPLGSFDSARRQRGATLFIVIFLAAIAAIAVLLNRLNGVSQKADQLGIAAGQQRDAKSALLGYARTNSGAGVWGLLPLPDMGKRDATPYVEGESAANFTADPARGLLANSNDALLIGRLPSKSLGISALRDNSTNCLWYAVSAAFKASNSGSPNYVPTYNWDTLGDFETGLSDNPHESRAVALVFGPGAPTNTQTRSPSGFDSVNECGGNYVVGNYLENLAVNPANPTTDTNQAVYYLAAAQPSPANPPAAAITAAVQSGAVATSDQVLAITSSEIFEQIARSGKIQSTLNDTLLPLLKSCLEAKNLPATGLTLVNSVPAGQSRYVGPLAPNGTLSTEIDCNTTITGVNAKELARWRDNIWYLTCNAPLSGCLQLVDTSGVNAPQSCDGLIVFSGSRTPATASRPAQSRATATDKSTPEQYMEIDPDNPGSPDVVNAFLPLLVTSVKARSALSAEPAELSQDVAICLNRPVPPTSAIVQIDTFADVTPVVAGETLVSREIVTDVITLGNPAISTASLGGVSAVGATFSGPLIGDVVGATGTTVTLSANASAENDVYVGFPIDLIAGTGQGQRSVVTDYDGATRTVTINPPWTTVPDASSGFKIDVGMLPFGSGVRVYFRLKILQYGDGFVFSLIDADRNLDSSGNPTARVSGGAGSSGQYLGYAGRNLDLSVPPIEFPKIGLEFDTVRNYLGAVDVNDTTNNHIALVYWGRSHDWPDPQPSTPYDDDNTHDIPADPLPADYGYPDPFSDSACGASQCANLRAALEINRDFHVRFEIDRQYPVAAGIGRYLSRLWIVREVDGMIPGMDNVEQDFTTISSLAPQHTQTVEMTNPVAGIEGFKHFRFGFTNAQSTRRQEVTIQDLKLRLR